MAAVFIDRSGQIYGTCLVLGPDVVRGRWRVRCERCGSEYVRHVNALRDMQGRLGCRNCRVTIRRDCSEKHQEWQDFGVRWVNGDGFRSTALGRLQQDFYLGRLQPNREGSHDGYR